MKYIQICMDCFHICMDCLYSLYELYPQNFCGGNPYNFLKLNISLILLIWRYSGICQSTVNTLSIVLYHKFILKLFCCILVNFFPLVVWIAPTLPYCLVLNTIGYSSYSLGVASTSWLILHFFQPLIQVMFEGVSCDTCYVTDFTRNKVEKSAGPLKTCLFSTLDICLPIA